MLGGPNKRFHHGVESDPWCRVPLRSQSLQVITYAGEHNRQLQTRPEPAGPLSTEL